MLLKKRYLIYDSVTSKPVRISSWTGRCRDRMGIWGTEWQGDWRQSVRFTIYGTSFVFLLNLVLVVCAATKATKNETGYWTIYEGDCAESSRLSTIFHIAINIASSVLLGGSNYCMVSNSSLGTFLPAV
jgi:hypothetical protein